MIYLIHPTYFPNILHFSALVKAETVYLEVCDNYQKQTLRNRTEILTPQGKLALTVPVLYSQNNRQLYKDVTIINDQNWQHLHLKSLKTTYNASPFFEYYIDELLPLFNKKFNYILDFNLQCMEVLLKIMELDINISYTSEFEKEPKDKTDLRALVKPHKTFITLPYTQVFSYKYNYVPNLSVLDLLFNEGPNTENYLLKQQL